jgi:hypothetical protein
MCPLIFNIKAGVEDSRGILDRLHGRKSALERIYSLRLKILFAVDFFFATLTIRLIQKKSSQTCKMIGQT